MEAFLVSTGLVALAEMGDKTQLLSLVLAARFRRPWPIVLGILIATVANHALAAAVGGWLADMVGPYWMRIAIGIGFLAMAAWALEDPPRAQKDRVHLTRDGYAQLGSSFASDLMRAYSGWRREQGLPATTAPRATDPERE